MVPLFFPSLTIALPIQILLLLSTAKAFAPLATTTSHLNTFYAAQSRNNNNNYRNILTHVASSPEDNNLGVIDLTDDDDDEIPTAITPEVTPAAPFLSQGELSDDPNLLSPDFNDAKQTRVIIYIILTLVPILFLVPLMIGSRDLIPLDALPPVDL